MTILPKTKKLIHKDRERERSCVASSSSERQRSGNLSRKKSRPGDANVQPPLKKCSLRSRSPSPRANSDDEKGTGVRNEQIEAEFAERLRLSRGWIIKEMRGDGACLFRSVADQVYGDQEMHGEVRRLCMDYMERNRDHFSPFIAEDFAEYITRKRDAACHGNHVEMQAMSEMYARPVEVYEYSDTPINTFLPSTAEMNAPLRLSYHASVHYNSVVDPHVATVGVGLGLPGMVPGAADDQLLADAVLQSDALHLEETMLHDKMHMTDWQRTEEDIKDQVVRESYVGYLQQLENTSGFGGGRVDKKGPGTSKLAHSADLPSSSKQHDEPCSSKQIGLYEELLTMEAVEWPEDNGPDCGMARAILLSQQQLFDDLKAKDTPGSSGNS